MNQKTIQKYIREQGSEDRLSDSISKREYIDPFKQSKQKFRKDKFVYFETVRERYDVKNIIRAENKLLRMPIYLAKNLTNTKAIMQHLFNVYLIFMVSLRCNLSNLLFILLKYLDTLINLLVRVSLFC